MKKLALHFNADAMHDAGADLRTSRQRGCDGLQERIATIDADRPSSGHDVSDFGIGQRERTRR
jgi:hypothetical protein